ncbi:MAG TPA: YqgE/AlgH family protein [Bacteroidales bacterium]|nr:YqgE/AlgH family protein [Bacteroidales bacterium]
MINKTIYKTPQRGKILISEPFLNDFYFKRSVVLLAEHGKEGSFGLIINKPIDINLKEIIKEFSEFNTKVFIGGPVRTDSLFVIHSLGKEIPNSTEIIEGIYWGGNMEVIREKIINKIITPDKIRFYIGYSGWSPNQLEYELKEKAWVISDASKEEILNNHPENLWKAIVKSLGKEYALWANYPIDPMLN